MTSCVASSGPLLVAVMVKLTLVRTVGASLSATLVTAMSTTRVESDAEAWLLSVLGSYWSAVTVAVFVKSRLSTVTVTWRVSVALSPLASVPTAQVPPRPSKMPWVALESLLA